MSISNEYLEEYKQIYLEELGVVLTTEEAIEKATTFLELIKKLVIDGGSKKVVK